MRIAQILLSRRVGGAESVAAGLESAWHQLGHFSKIFYVDPPYAKLSRAQRTRSLREAIKLYTPDIVVAHSAIPNVYARIATPLTIPVGIVLHSSAGDYQNFRLRTAERLLKLRTSFIIAVGENQRTEYASYFSSHDKLHVIPNGIQLPTRVQNLSDRSRVTITTLARVAPVKNPWLWSNVAKRFASHEPPTTFHWWGTPDSQEMANVISSGTQESKAARFRGPYDNIEQALETTDILFHPSDREAQGLAILEAAARGIPVVCSRTATPNFTTESPFVLFEPGDVDTAVSALNSVLANYAKHRTAAGKFASYIRRQYSLERCAARYLRVFDAVLTRRREN